MKTCIRGEVLTSIRAFFGDLRREREDVQSKSARLTALVLLQRLPNGRYAYYRCAVGKSELS